MLHLGMAPIHTHVHTVVIFVHFAAAAARPPLGSRAAPTSRPHVTQNTSTVCGIIETCYMFLLEHQMIGMMLLL
jgi:hypothetical protein